MTKTRKKSQITLLLAIFLCVFTSQLKADSWTDPSWKEMLDNSDVIALVEYKSNGDFRASAKVITVYSGRLKGGDEIFISGFSNRYGPIDKMAKGDKYLVFLKLNQPTSEGLKYWEKQLTEDSALKEFFNAYKKGMVYYVWSPTSGDLKVIDRTVQYDLIQTSFHSQQNFYALEEFERFLKAYIRKDNVKEYCGRVLREINPANESDLSTQYLMKLFLLGYNQFDDVYRKYANVDNPSSKYALAKVMGNIKSEQSREILFGLLADKHGIVQSEVVRQLKHEPVAIVAPILLKRLQTASELNFGATNLMNPVRNSVDGGMFEIIKTLGELNYQPAIPYLLPFLDTYDDEVFELVIETLKNLSSKDYIPYINKHLDNKNYRLMFKISMLISKDSLVECLPSFKNFISTCDRNMHTNYEYTISTCCGIGHFRDSATIGFLLSDYERFYTYKDTLESSKQKYWTKQYIQTFTDLQLKEARPFIYQSIYDWFGFNDDFGKYPKLFNLKTRLEDSLQIIFKNKLAAKGYRLSSCIAFIQNIHETIAGQNPIVKYLIEVTVPSTDKGQEHLEIVMNELQLPQENVYIRFSDGVYHIQVQDRFDQRLSSTPLEYFIDYAAAIPNSADIDFLQALLDNNIVSENYFQKQIRQAIMEIKARLQK